MFDEPKHEALAVKTDVRATAKIAMVFIKHLITGERSQHPRCLWRTSKDGR
jgi:hypothetical protein